MGYATRLSDRECGCIGYGYVCTRDERYTLCDVILYCVTFCKEGEERGEREDRSMLVFLLDIDGCYFSNKNVILIRKMFVCIWKGKPVSMLVSIG